MARKSGQRELKFVLHSAYNSRMEANFKQEGEMIIFGYYKRKPQ